MLITEKIRKKLLLCLPRGYAKTIKTECNCSEMTVYRVLHHGQDNEKVAMALINLAANNKVEKRKKSSALKKLASKL